MNGFILVSRSVLESGIWSKPPLYIKVWIYLLTKAQFADSGNLKRGQLYTSIPEIQKACSYKIGFRTETPSKKEIWSILDYLRNPHEADAKETVKEPMIETTKATHGMLVTICKYSDYQDPTRYEGNGEVNGDGTLKRKRRKRQGNNINKKDKESNKDNNISSSLRSEDIYTPPTREEVQEYVKEKDLAIDADYFYDYYEDRGWRNKGGDPVRNWKLTARSWHNREVKNGNGNGIRRNEKRDEWTEDDEAVWQALFR